MTVTQERRALLPPSNVAPLASPTNYPLHVLGEPLIAFAVLGTPGPQGSKKQVGTRKNGPRKGQAIMVESSKKVMPWRNEVAKVARLAVGAGFEPLTCPLVLDMVFTMDRPASFPAKDPTNRRAHGMPTVYPDVSKLLRSTEDALTKIVWNDDAQIIDYRRAAMRYVGTNDPDVLRAPGAVVRVWRMPQSVIDLYLGRGSVLL